MFLAACLDLARDVDREVTMATARTCLDIITSAATDDRLPERSRRPLDDLGRALVNWSIAAERLVREPTDEAALASAHAAHEFQAAAGRIDLDLVPY